MGQTQRDSNADGVKSFFWMLDLAVHLTLWGIAVTFLAVLADLAAAYTWWRADPVGGMEALVRYYVAQTTDPELVRWAADGLYWSWFGWTRIDASARAYVAGAQPERGFGGALASLMFGDGRTLMTVAMYGVKLVGIRAAMLAMTLPQFVLAVLVAVTDGLVARYVRRKRGGHESATRYHHARRLLLFGLIPLVATVWIVVPMRMPIEVLFCPLSLAVILALWMMAKFYKKYM
ncbi:DUF4400 domain-containing protein [Trinickia symbiotica]|uniref:DUF4400 domain-containing protein n=1 Tax=Trinickia symbiotica TaxID=863227 RepID=UPI00037CB6C2|nr:DUF4400 domain-containing protein [Trinickia symbiotica]